MQEATKVWVLVIDQIHCDFHVEVFTCEEHAYQALFEYSLYDWDDAWGDREELFQIDVINIAAECHEFRWEIVERKIQQ